MHALIEAATAEKPALQPNAAIGPAVRAIAAHILAQLAEEKSGTVDCVAGASVQLVKDGASVAITTTDNYGDFKFDRLDENSGRYSVQIFSGGRSKTVETQLGVSVNLGEIRL